MPNFKIVLCNADLCYVWCACMAGHQGFNKRSDFWGLEGGRSHGKHFFRSPGSPSLLCAGCVRVSAAFSFQPSLITCPTCASLSTAGFISTALCQISVPKENGYAVLIKDKLPRETENNAFIYFVRERPQKLSN